MKDFLWLIINPSKSFERINERQFSNSNIFLIYFISSCLMFLPKMVEVTIKTGQIMTLFVYLAVLPLMYFFIYPVTYVFRTVIQGFNGKISFTDMKMIIVLSALPIALKTIILLPFVLLKADISIIDHGNYFTSLVFWLLSFRIIIIGIAKYNKFNWMITLVVWAISITILAVFGYFLNLYKNSFHNPLINRH